MTDYIKAIADKLMIEKKPIILYGAGTDAVFIILRLQSRYSVTPTCICDSNISKYHKKIRGVEIISFEEALSCYPDAFLYISSRTCKHEIIGNLISGGKVTQEQILNFESVEQRKSCRYLENDIVVNNHCLSFCCSDFGKNSSPYVEFKGNYELAAKDFILLRDKLICDLSKGIPTSCDGCPSLQSGFYPAKREIRLYNYGEVGVCNYNCAYCASPARHCMKIEENEIDCRRMLSVLESLGLASEDYETDLAVGEITVHPKRGEIYDTVKHRASIILTNASIYDEELAGILKSRGRLYISIDAGTKETYAKIKGADLFEKVCANLKNYSATVGFAPFELKYIFMPDVNDNEADVNGFVELCAAVGANQVLISYDFNAPFIKETTIIAVKRMIEKLDAEGMEYKIISDVINCEIAKR